MTTESRTQTFVHAINQFSVLMLTSQDHTGSFHGCPMVRIHTGDDGTLWFATNEGGDLTKAFNVPHPVSITGQSGSAYVHVTGFATTQKDRSKAKEVWTERLRPWFPNGAESEDLVLIKVHPQHASVWDSSISDVLGFAWKAIKAVATGNKIESPSVRTELDLNEKHPAA